MEPIMEPSDLEAPCEAGVFVSLEFGRGAKGHARRQADLVPTKVGARRVPPHTSLLPQVQARPVRIAAYDFRGTDEDDRWNLASTEPIETDWSAVTARCLAYLCLQHSDVQDKGLFERATFLMNLGLPRSDAAALLGSTDESLRVTLRGKPAKKARSKKQDK
jgi:hypothetical protein